MQDETPRPSHDAGLDPADRPRALGLIFKRHGRKHVRPTVPTRVTIFRSRTGVAEAWEIVAWIPFRSEFVAWRRDINYDHRLKAKEFVAECENSFDEVPVPAADRWTDEPMDEPEDPFPPDDPSRRDTSEESFLQALDLGLTEPNSATLARYGNSPPESPPEP
jgi:hypothetical protein